MTKRCVVFEVTTCFVIDLDSDSVDDAVVKAIESQEYSEFRQSLESDNNITQYYIQPTSLRVFDMEDNNLVNSCELVGANDAYYEYIYNAKRNIEKVKKAKLRYGKDLT